MEKQSRRRIILLFLFSGIFALFFSFLTVILIESALARFPIKEDVRIEKKKEGENPLGKEAITDVITRRNLFRAKLNVELPKPKTEKELEEEALTEIVKEMTLKGVILGKETESYAIIDRGKNKGVWAYSVGEIVERGLAVKEIKHNEVLLDKGDFSFKLKLFAKGYEKTSSVKEGEKGKVERHLAKIPSDVIKKERGAIVIDKKFVEKAKNDKDLFNSIASTVAIKAWLDGKGNPAGIKIVSIDKGSLVERMGILPNDIVQEVNGLRLSNHEDLRRAYDELKDATKFVVKILRQGREKTLYYEIK